MEDVGDGYIFHREDFQTSGSDEDEDADEWESDTEENYILPEPKEYGLRARGYGTSINDEVNRIQGVFREKGIQVIVKLANIHLTPEGPTYDGGSWHVEGQLNEHICASALYYYDEENITPSYLAFRELVNGETLMSQADQNREHGFCAVYGIEDHWGDALQVLGKIRTREDRLLVFPNVLQHRVSPFKLEDHSKPGHRKLLALFLVDPNIRIPSTANVPPQQAEWFIRGGQMESVFGHFPNEIADQIVGEMDFPFTAEKAKSMRLDLIEERGNFQEEVIDSFREDGYSFCEH